MILCGQKKKQTKKKDVCVGFKINQTTANDEPRDLWPTTCPPLRSARREPELLERVCVWSRKRGWNKSTVFHVAEVKVFQRHQPPSVYPPEELFAHYVVPLCRRQAIIASGYTTTVCICRLDFIKAQKIAPDRDHRAPSLLPPVLRLTWQTEPVSWWHRLNMEEKINR